MQRFFLLILTNLSFTLLFASRAVTEWKSYLQPDGTVLTLTLTGDEHFSYYQDIAGNKYALDETGLFRRLSQSEIKQSSRRRAFNVSLLNGHPEWDANRTYRQLVILVEFENCSFSIADPLTFYQRMFNETDYNYRDGAGCVADYFRDQSNGLFNLQFDIYGPYIGRNKPTSSKTEGSDLGESVFQKATRQFVEEHPDMDFSPYDWDGNGELDQVVYIYAGYSGNQAGYKNYIWPNSGNFVAVKTGDGHVISLYSASAEHWANEELCGIGTMCHEFSHCLGLPDIYPTSEKALSPYIVDEWDLMDGGTVTNYGWCPPNYSPMEKMLLGWLEPVELTEDKNIEGLKTIADGGDAYLIKHTDDEFLLLENRQWKGWDYGLPGRGLVVYHVYFDQLSWSMNMVNIYNGYPYYSLVAADRLNYLNWVDIIRQRGLTSQFADSERRLHCLALSSAAYPYATDSTEFVNNCLTDTSLPSSVMYTNNASGSRHLSKPITDITQNDDGTISFVFHASMPEAIIAPRSTITESSAVYTLTGRKVQSNAINELPKGIYLTGGKKIVIK